jgi:hypothetical protein
MRRCIAAAALAVLVFASTVVGRPPSIVGGTGAQSALLARILDRVEPVHIGKVELLSVGKHRSARPPRVIRVRFHAASTDIHVEWNEWLAAGVFARESRMAGLPTVGFVESWGPRGLESGVALGARPVRSAGPAAEADLRRRLLRAGRASRAHLERLTLVRPHGIGYALVLRADHPAFFLRYRALQLLRKLNERWSQYEGAYIKVVDRHRQRVWGSASSTRIGVGAGWVRPDLEDCDPLPGFGTRGDTPPPCPV